MWILGPSQGKNLPHFHIMFRFVITKLRMCYDWLMIEIMILCLYYVWDTIMIVIGDLQL